MSGINQADESVDCPLCMESLEMDDLNFYPCTCGYQICRFCWHRIRTDGNGLCPACRKAYPENPADFKPLTQEELQRIKQEKRQKDLQRKRNVSENRKHLANVRVVQKNLVFVVGLSARLADPETLKKPECFGRFGKIHKVVINHSTSYAGSQGPSASAYVTYHRAEDALRALQEVNKIHVDGRTLKASLGTTKYCSHFMKNQPCPKPDCMYLHELGDEAASFTKEEMQQGKHQEFEKKLQEQYLGISLSSDKMSTPLVGSTGGGNSCSSTASTVASTGATTTVSATATSTSGNSSTGSGRRRAGSGEGKENSASKITGDDLPFGAGLREAWPALNAMSNKDGKKSKSKCDKNNGSARHTPTEEQNNNHKRENKDLLAKLSLTRESGYVMCNRALGILEVDGNPGGSAVTSSTSSAQDSCASSTSTTPPPAQDFFNQPCIPASTSSSSPLPVITCSVTHSPFPTPSSSLSSSSEPSSSLPCCCHVPTTSLSAADETECPIPNHRLYINSEPLSGVEHSHLTERMNDKGARLARALMPDLGKAVNSTRDLSPLLYEFDGVEDDQNKNDADDDLGFDPFEETNKALAEDIKIEQKQLLQQQQQQRHNQAQQQTPSDHQFHFIPIRDNTLDVYNGVPNMLCHTAPPPPGFNGLTSLSQFGSSAQNAAHLGKSLPSYHGNVNAIPNLAAQNLGSGNATHLNGMVGSSRLGIPPGLGGGLLSGASTTSLNSGLINNLGNGIQAQLAPQALGVEVTPTIGLSAPGLSQHKVEPNQLKDLENSLRQMLPVMSSVSTMNTLNSTLNSLAAASPNATSHANSLSNFLSLAQQQQQLHQNHQNLQQLTVNLFPSAQKAWSNNGIPDLTAIDPAIVSSGQLTDSRSDSPPQWLKAGEPFKDNGIGNSSFNSFLPYGLMPSGLHSSIGLHNTSAVALQRPGVWPPTSPPPGFTSISPLHLPKQHEPHKIENI